MLSLFKVFISKDVKDPLTETLYSGFISQGEKVESFESKLREMFDYPYIVTLNSATAGLTMAIRMIKDKFITTNDYQNLKVIDIPSQPFYYRFNEDFITKDQIICDQDD